jgi:hypothetical protein
MRSNLLTLSPHRAVSVLAEAASAELRAEIAADAELRCPPPLLPAHWTMSREPGSRKLTWSRDVTSSKFASSLPQFAERASRTERRLYRTVTVSAQFRTVDFTMWDSTRDICEFVPLHVNVRAPARASQLVFLMAAANSRLKLLQVGAQASDDSQRARYGGPLAAELSRSLSDGLMDYLDRLGVDARFAEHVCQSLYFEEHQEYLAWLHRLANFAVPPSPETSKRAARFGNHEGLLDWSA